ncbi:uncharacterized protein LOC126834855 [Adelges cooleyi]|uniref:uncharacterized protein LOC126834855 n=1 Tax=Adelges cooleyi TaxID=133065 RepID=UPI00217FF024|nr:uncharacterized protein LOC126834855 [Adelges cooleyi]
MKLFCFLTSLIFVNVSTDDLMDYQTNIAITNAHIKLASEKIIVGDGFVESGLEQVIKNIIEDDTSYSLGVMNNIIAVPETPHLNDFQESARHQSILREKIEKELDIPVPKVSVVLESDFRRLTLINLGSKRRDLTKEAIINIWNQDVVGSEEQFSSLWICRLIALFMSTKFPLSYVRDIQFDPDTCIIYDGVIYKTYKKIEDEWWIFTGNVNWLKLEKEFVY